MRFVHLQDPNVQQQIKSLCYGKSGVYLITNLKNNNQYVGSAITKKPSLNRLYIRFRNHFFNTHKNFPIRRAIKKYGVINFSWEILEFTEIENTRARETFYLKTLKPEYNILDSAESSLGYHHTPATRKKMKSHYGQKRRDRIGDFNRGKTLSLPQLKIGDEIREKLSQKAKNRNLQQKMRHQQSCDTFNKSVFSKSTQVLDGDTQKILGTYSSLKEACRVLNGDYRTFKRCVKSGKKMTKFNIFVKYIS